MGNVVKIEEARTRDHLGESVRDTVEESLSRLLDAAAEQLLGAGRYERTEARRDTRACYYCRKLHRHDVFGVLPKGEVKEVAMMLKAIHASEDREAAR